MNVFQIECFLAVAEFLNFARAAEIKNISQPAITRQIQSLEAELNVKLFKRNTRSVRLTREGISFLNDARTIADTSRRAIQRFEKKDRQEIRGFSIGCSGLDQMEPLSDVLEPLLRLYPYLHPNLRLIPGSRILDSLDQGELDVAFGFYFSQGKSSLKYRELRKVPFTCVCRSDSPLCRLQTVTAEDLKPYPMIVYGTGTAALEVITMQWEWAKDRPPSELYFSESAEFSMFLVEAGVGISILPDLYIPPYRRLTSRRLQDTRSLSFGLYYKSGQETPYLKDFIRFMTERFASSNRCGGE